MNKGLLFFPISALCFKRDVAYMEGEQKSKKGWVEIVHGERWKDSFRCLQGQHKEDKVTSSGRAHPSYVLLNDQYGACGEVC